MGDYLGKRHTNLALSDSQAGKTVKGVASGAATGATIGSFVPIPGVGTAAGAAVGAGVGAVTSFFGKSSHKNNKEAFQNAPSDKVTVFWDAGFNGHSQSYRPGAFEYLGKHDRDEISSVKVPDGLKLQVWHGGKPIEILNQPSNKHYHQQPDAEFTSSQRYVGDSHNDHIDTIRVTRVEKKAPAKTTKQELNPPNLNAGSNDQDGSDPTNIMTNTLPAANITAVTQQSTAAAINDNSANYVAAGLGSAALLGGAILIFKK